ncbi:GGDEF domain-containing protein [uncultured Modestobacter sp.]|uniref:GGDEF domain-containing protein n=1 Tax=uncultured Modestobacter sp. TaxID=380048 RepID=UPI002622B6BC|nr:sensor domain-containing diguanylate cyclase [uncultured Modestobacter sp.]
MSAVVNATTALVVMVDGDGRILLANPAMERFTGLAGNQLLGRLYHDVYVIPVDIPRAQRAVAAALADGTSFFDEGDWLRADRTWRRMSMQNSVVTDDDDRPYAIATVAIDVTEQREREALVARRATTDALTGAWNRGVLFEALQEHLAPDSGRGCALLFCDVDDFKAVNDEHGHAIGDQLLVEVADRLMAWTGAGDLVSRFGGDEFVVLYPGLGESEVTAMASRVQARMREPLEIGAVRVPLSVSVGSATGRPGDDPDQVLALADRTMYRRKRSRTAPSEHRRR